MSAAKRSGSSVTLGTWGIRAIVAVVLGSAIGAAGGVIGVNTLEPGHKEQPDSLQLMLDSIAKGAVGNPPDARAARRAADSADADQRAQRLRDSVEMESMIVTIPDVSGQSEGDARAALAALRFKVGSVQFEPANTPQGTVIRTMPAGGESISPNRRLTLFVSTGVPPLPTDTTAAAQRL